jgi:CRP-like cAMP-binding protein
LKTHHLLHDPGDTLKSAYFCNTGLVSILCVFPDGKSVEVGLVGKEGFVGLPLVAGFPTASTRAIAQIDGTAFRVDGETLMAILRQCPRLERRLQQFSQISAMQVTQIAACNRLHEVDERLARWLLMSADRIGSNALPLTQEFLAQMLGTHRPSVTVAAGMLEKAGLIAQRRGAINIVSRRKLEEAACECYGIMQRQLKEWMATPK